MTTYVYPDLVPLEFWDCDVPKGKVSYTDRKYHSLDVKLNWSPLPEKGLSPLFTLYEKRPMSIFDDIDLDKIVPENPRAAQQTYDQKNKESTNFDILLDAMSKKQADDKHKVNASPSTE